MESCGGRLGSRSCGGLKVHCSTRYWVYGVISSSTYQNYTLDIPALDIRFYVFLVLEQSSPLRPPNPSQPNLITVKFNQNHKPTERTLKISGNLARNQNNLKASKFDTAAHQFRRVAWTSGLKRCDVQQNENQFRDASARDYSCMEARNLIFKAAITRFSAFVCFCV